MSEEIEKSLRSAVAIFVDNINILYYFPPNSIW